MKNKTSEQMLVIYGCGGHARSVADVALCNGVNHLRFVDKNAKQDEKLFGFAVVAESSHDSDQSCIVAAGDNQDRANIYELLQKNNTKIESVIAKDAHIGKDATLAAGVFVGHGAYIGPQAEVGENTIINTHCVIEHNCKIGKHSHVSINATLAGKSQVGDFVMIGAGATLIDNVRVCSHVIIGAGAVVISDITEPGTYVGVPARKVK